MRWKSTVVRVTALLGAALLMVTACGSGGSGTASSPGEPEDRPPTSAPGAPVTVVAGSWGGKTDEWTKIAFKDFEEKSGITLQQEAAPGQQVAQIEAQVSAGKLRWDMLSTDVGVDVYYLDSKGLLAHLPEATKSKLVAAFGADNVTDFGIVFGSVAPVLVCRKDTATKCPTDFEQFFDTENYPGPRTLSGVSPVYALTAALIADGVAKDEVFPMDLDRAFAKLATLKPHVAVWWTSGDQSQQAFRNGQAVMGMIYNGRAYDLISQGMDLQVSWEGAIRDPSYQVILKGAEHQDQAFQMMEWLADNPDACRDYMIASNYDCPNVQAIEALPQETLEKVPSTPDHLKVAAPIDVPWVIAHLDEINDRWKQFLAG